MKTAELYIFKPNGNTADTNFLNNPFVPLNIASIADQYASFQLLTILSIDAQTCPYYAPVHKEQLFNVANAKQNQIENTLTFAIPADHPDAQYVVEGNLVAFKDLDGNFELFEIMTPADFHADTLYRQIIAINVAQSELNDDWISHLSVTSQDATSTLTQLLDGTQWQVGQVDVGGTGSVTIDTSNVLAGLQTVLPIWGGEFRFRVTIGGNRITGMYVDWLQRRGNVTGKRFVYGKDLARVQRTVDMTNVKTALYGYGKQDANGNYLTFANVTWSKANGDPVDKPPGQEWVGDPTALSQWGRAGGVRHRFGAISDGRHTDPTLLLQSTWNTLQSIKTPLLTYQMSVVDLEQIAGLSHEAVRIGDTVSVIDMLIQPTLREQARIIEIDRDLIDPLNTQIVLGNFLPTTLTTDTQVSNLQSQVNSIQGGTVQVGDPIAASSLTGIMNLLNTQIQSDAAYVYVTNTDGILVLNAPKDQNPTKAIKLGGGIVAIANSKNPDGTWKWTTFGTGDGFIADLINAGTLNANLVNVTNLNASNITAGTLDARKVSVTNLDAGNIKTGTLNAINVTGSSITGSTVQSVNGNNTATLQNGELDTVENNVNGWNLTAKVNGAGLQLTATSGTTTYNFSVVADPSNGLTLNSNTGTNIYGPSGIFLNNNTTITGNYSATGTKSAIVKTKSHGTRKLYAMESPEIWFEDFGEAQTDDTGHVTVPLEMMFAETVDVSKTDYKVFVQGVDTADLRVSSRTPTEFTVVGAPNATFMYRLVAKRLGFADIRLERHDDKEV